MIGINILLMVMSYCLAFCGAILAVGVMSYRDSSKEKRASEQYGAGEKYSLNEISGTLTMAYGILDKLAGEGTLSPQEAQERTRPLAKYVHSKLNNPKGENAENIQRTYEDLKRNVSKVMEYIKENRGKKLSDAQMRDLKSYVGRLKLQYRSLDLFYRQEIHREHQPIIKEGLNVVKDAKETMEQLKYRKQQ